MLALRPAVFIGDISYSWYLWHWPFVVFARATWPGSVSAPVAALLSLVPAWLSYRYVENPIRRSQRLTTRGTLVMGAATIMAGVLACGVLVVGNRWVTGSNGYGSIQRALRTHRGCPVRGEGRKLLVAGDPEVASRCTWPLDDASGTIALLGDSNAGHISEPVVKAARTLDREVYRATSNGCPFVDVTMVVLGDRRGDCRQFYEKSMRIIERMRPDLVVIGSTTTRYIDEKQFGLVVGRAGPTATSPDAKLGAWRRGLHRTVTRLADAGIATLVVHPVPKFPGWDLRGCAAGRVALAQFTCGRSTARGRPSRTPHPRWRPSNEPYGTFRGPPASSSSPSCAPRRPAPPTATTSGSITTATTSASTAP